MKWIVMIRYEGDEMYQPYSCKVHEKWADAMNEALWIRKTEDGIANISVDEFKEGEQ